MILSSLFPWPWKKPMDDKCFLANKTFAIIYLFIYLGSNEKNSLQRETRTTNPQSKRSISPHA
jgi:hypothetical protein